MLRFIFGVLFGAALAVASVVGGVFLRDGNVQALKQIDLDRLDVSQLDLSEVELRTGDIVPVARRTLNRLMPDPGPQPVTIVLNREGGRLYAGPDHAGIGTSSVLMRNQVAALDVPAYRISDARWRSLKQCVRSRFSGYQVTVVDQAPSSGDYMVVHFGGSPESVGYQKTTRGLAPFTGRLIRNAPVFVFTHGKPDLTELCDTAAHEAGHAIGLDHSRQCTDLMSYRECGKKRFRDRVARCGEWESRDCQDGNQRQNSAAKLEATVGRRPVKPAIV